MDDPTRLAPPAPEGKRVLVVGFERTGIATACFLAGRAGSLTVSERRPREVLDAAALAALERAGVRFETGGHQLETFLTQDLIVVSPGVPMQIEPLVQARARDVWVVSEIELAAPYLSAPVVAVTGTNGKSTVTTLIGEIVAAAGLEAFVGGNLGTPLVACAPLAARKDFLVVEVSSFQLEGIHVFRPAVAVILNVTEDHLDRYASFAEYAAAKARLLENQLPTDTAVLSYDDPVTRGFAHGARARVVFTSLRGRPPGGPAVWAEGDRFLVDLGEAATEAYDAHDLKLEGVHNRDNALAALAAARAMGIRGDVAMEAIRSFGGLPHRMETVATVAGVRYVNDSKATNVAAAAQSVATYRDGVTLLAGGIDKGGSYDPLVEAARGRVRQAVVFGKHGPLVGDALERVVPVTRVADLTEAVARASELARPGDVVLLAPACASYDQFRSFEERGATFRRLVLELARGETRARGVAPAGNGEGGHGKGGSDTRGSA